MKDWIYGRMLMDEAGDEGGGGSSGGEAAEGMRDEKEGMREEGSGIGDQGSEEINNALANDLNKGDEGSGDGDQTNPEGDSSHPSSPIPHPSEITEEEAKTYDTALKLDEKLFGEKADFDPFYRAAMPAFFKRHGIEPEKANKMANEFVAMQKKAGEKKLEELRKAHEERDAGLQRMNEAYYRDYDKPARETIGKAVRHFVKKNSALWHTLVKTEVGVDKELLEILHFVGERLPNDSVRGGADGAGANQGKSISDSFMGL